jgi:NitT/TauT family transport system ATP-binding protein
VSETKQKIEWPPSASNVVDWPAASAPRRPQLSIESIAKVYPTADGPIAAIGDFSLSVAEGEFVTIVGPSGCGKSTLLRMVLGIVAPTSGRLLLRGIVIEGPQPGVGMVFQSPVLMRWRTVLENVLLPIEILGKARREYDAKALDLLKLVGLAGFENRFPRELSGGMQQRVAICRALIHEPDLLLMDEPFGALDALTRELMAAELLRLWALRRKTVLFVTHDINEAVFLGDRVVAMTPRPGCLALMEEIALPRPRSARTKSSPEFAAHVLRLRSILGLVPEGGS